MALPEHRMARAPHSKRLFAGLIDLLAIAFLSFVYFAVPMLLRGLVVPMWGVLLAVLGYAIVPLSFLKKTLGMKLFGLELATKDGHGVDLANVAFRELIGRGYFPAAFLFTVLAGLVAQALHVAAFAMPTGLAAFMVLVSLGTLAGAVLGHFLAFNREDGRTLADLLTRSYVVAGPARPPPEDQDEREAAQSDHRSRVTRIAIFEVLLIGAAIGLPWFLTSSGGETSSQRGDRIVRESLQKRFAADPGNDGLTRDLERELWNAGLAEEAGAVERKHQDALRVKEKEREQKLKDKLAQNPGDEATATALLSMLEEQDRLADAKAVYQQWLGTAPAPSKRLGFSQWLLGAGFTEESVTEAQAALAAEPLLPMGHTLLGVALEKLGRHAEAQEELSLALLDDETDDDAVEALADVDAQLGPLPAAKKKALALRVQAWRGDAGVR